MFKFLAMIAIVVLAFFSCSAKRPPSLREPHIASPERSMLTTSAMGIAPRAADASARAVVIYDPGDHHRDTAIIDEIGKAEDARVLGKVFSKYLTDQANCSYGAGFGDLEGARSRGAIVPRVMSKARGSFTAPRTAQTLYLVFVGECGAIHADNWGSDMLVVMQGDIVISRVIIGGGSSLRGVFDLDGDGRQEILLDGGFSNQGATYVSASLARIDGATLTTIKDFGSVYEDNCGFVPPPGKGTERFLVIRAIVNPGAPAEFERETKSLLCP